jgi:3-phenylpropionate/trans-cinnamate dioxygenase ferredoxin reductase component
VARLVIVGASLAGLRAAQAARAAGHDSELVVIGEETHMPYTRPPLSKELLAGLQDVGAGAFPAEEVDADWRLGVRATALDPSERAVRLDDGEALGYDRLILATGCRARQWTGPGAELDGLHTLRDVDDALALRDALEDSPRLAVLGAGFIGCEVTASARKLGIDVTLVDIAPLPMPGLGPAVGERCAQMHREHGVDVRLGVGISAFHGSDRVEEVELDDGSRVNADIAVVALGAIPNTEWLAGSGLQIEPGVMCDATLAAVGAEDVWCAGDIAKWPHPLSPEPIRIEHWTNAAEQGKLAGRNAVSAPEERRPYESVPSFWSDQYDVKIQAIGLPRLAERVQVVEESPEGDRWLAVGEREGRIIAAMGFNAARRLPWYRRQIADGAATDDVLTAVAEDPKAFGAPAQVST